MPRFGLHDIKAVRWVGPSIRAGAWALVLCASLFAGARAEERIVFNRDIRPILSENCFLCHGPDANQRQADLRLDVRQSAIDAGAIVPGDAELSEVVVRILHEDPEMRMPPPDSRKTLTGAQKELLKRWIAEGAKYQRHWSYERPSKSAVPQGVSPVDYFVGKKLAERGLEPAPEADRRTLIRRLSFDLLGLPPKAQEVEAFLADTSPDAYEDLVERLLASPHFGERMAIGWLDVVRFADTIGYHSDNPRNIWPYRDYVIDSFNRNKPFDQFTIEQLAGDLLDNPTLEQRVASGFNHLLLTTEEGGAQAKDYEARMLADRVRAVGTVWLGQTLGCCQCHDHKFDPATQRDFYSLGAFFADIEEPIIGRRDPGILVPDEEQADELARLEARVAELEAELERMPPERLAEFEAWKAHVRSASYWDEQWITLAPQRATSQSGVRLRVDDGRVLAERNPDGGKDTYRFELASDATRITGLRIDVLPHDSLPDKGPGRGVGGRFVLSEVRLEDAAGQAIQLAHASATFEASGFPAAAAVDGKVDRGNGWAPGNQAGATATICLELAEPIGGDTPVRFTLVLEQQEGNNQVIGQLRVRATSAEGPIRAPAVALPSPQLVDLVRRSGAGGEPSPQEQQQLLAYFRESAPSLAPLRDQLARARRELAAFEASIPRSMVTVARNTPRTVRILPRGNWMDESGPIVEPALPEYLAGASVVEASATASSADRRLTRLHLAQWIVSPDNPLTARVMANRLWKQFFGEGLCRTVDDLGSQGEWPTHLELLDWLACEFVDSGWDVKHIIRILVTSDTYRRVSTASDEARRIDPENRLLSHQNRFRMEAELIRDNALAVSGLLDQRIGGPSVKPYQPDGYWENLNFPVRQYEPSRGADQYRRGLYTWWQRTFLHPSLLAFDAPSREECAANRSRSNIPQQALVLLNDPTYVEASRAFAARILTEGGTETDERLRWAWREALQRDARDEELEVCRSVVQRMLDTYQKNPESAEALLQVGFWRPPDALDRAEFAAWTHVGRILINLHESITRN